MLSKTDMPLPDVKLLDGMRYEKHNLKGLHHIKPD